MKECVIDATEVAIGDRRPGLLTGLKNLYDRFQLFLDEPFESDWERKTGTRWQEWNKNPYWP